MASFVELEKEFSELLGKFGQKMVKPALKVAVNKALKESLKVAKAEVKNRYSLPATDKSVSALGRPSLKSQLKHETLRSVGAISAGVPGKIYAADKRLSLVRFIKAQDQKPRRQKGIKVKNRKPLKAKIGKRTTTFKSRFVAKTKGGVHVFRRMRGVINPDTKKEKLALQRLASTHNIISRKKTAKAMLDTGSKALEEAFATDIKKRIEKALAKKK